MTPTPDTTGMDTGEAVAMPWPHSADEPRQLIRWTDLTPFEQGYVGAMFAERVRFGEQGWVAPLNEVRGFSDLAPATLAQIRADCRRFRGRTSSQCERIGALFWKNRAAGYLSGDGWMPLRLYLNDQGLVCTANEAVGALIEQEKGK